MASRLVNSSRRALARGIQTRNASTLKVGTSVQNFVNNWFQIKRISVAREPATICGSWSYFTHVDLPPLVFGGGAGVIGAGRIGRVHLETLAGVHGVQPVILSDVVEPVLKEVTAKYGVPKYTLNADEVIHDPEVQAVSNGQSIVE